MDKNTIIDNNIALQAVMNTVLDGLVIINKEGVIQSFNPAAGLIFGCKPEEVIGRNVKMLMPDPYHSQHDNYLKNYLETGDAKVIGVGREVVAQRKDGSVFPMELGINEMNLEGELLFVGTIRDISERKKAQEDTKIQNDKLAESHALHKMLMESIADCAIITLTLDGNVSSWNAGAQKIKGYTEEEILGKHFSLFYSQEDIDNNVPKKILETVLETGKFETEEIRVRKDGNKFWASLVIDPLKDYNGKTIGFVNITQDITKRKDAELKAARQIAKIKAIVDNTVDGIITIDELGNIETFNLACEKIFGYKAKEVIGKNVKMLMPDPYHKEHDGYLKNYRDTGDKKIIGIGREVKGLRKDNSTFPVDLSVSEVITDGVRIFSGIVRDITELKEAQHKIQEFVEALKHSNQELDDFAYIASHDLKEPLRGLSNNAVFLKEDYQDKLDQDGIKRLDRITYLCERMERLVDDLLYFSRLGRQELAIQETNIGSIIKDIQFMMETTLNEQNVVIKIPQKLPDKIICDVPRITELLRNLITNAIKYNHSDNKIIEIGTIEASECNNDNVNPTDYVFYVSDNGIGIEQEFYDDVFRIFKRLNSEDDDIKGTGVGLTFVKKIVERHGGVIWIAPNKPNGTIFYFSISKNIGAKYER